MMSSREQILSRLRGGERPFPDAAAPADYRPMTPIGDTSPAVLQSLFIAEARKAACVVHVADTPEAALAAIMTIVGADMTISSWAPAHIPLPGLAEALDAAHIALVGQDADARVGLTGVDVALSATGSIVVTSGASRHRASSLLPPVHIAVVAASQVVPDLESWLAGQRAAGAAAMRRSSNVVVITGPSRTADIAMQLVMGMHGPRELHLVFLTNA
jgi:L-lactate dehydrogenase complex protein LldG